MASSVVADTVCQVLLRTVQQRLPVWQNYFCLQLTVAQ